MTVLRDLYRTRPHSRPRNEASFECSQQGRVTDLTLLNREAGEVHRPTSEDAQRAMASRFDETLFLADWVDAVFLHFEVEAEKLQPDVPFELDDFNGRCFVSLVAFTMRDMRLSVGGRLTRWLTAPLANQRFLNLRTYVRHGRETGIFFMREWLDNPLAVRLGPVTFGLPYEKAKLDYDHDGLCPTGRVETRNGVLAYGGGKEGDAAPAMKGTVDEFLFERYTAFTNAGRRQKFFRVWHPPWELTELTEVTLEENSLFDGLGMPWVETARLVSVHHTFGVHDVWMSRPHRV